MEQSPLRDIFTQKYKEFATDLLGALPELTAEINASMALDNSVQFARFVAEVLPTCKPNPETAAGQTPGAVLPGVVISQDLWNALGVKSQSAIQEYLTILSFCCMYESSKEGTDSMKDWTDTFLKQWKDKLSSIDFDEMSKKLSGFISGLGPSAFPKLPEKFLKGHLAKLAEELVREFKPEDFGLSEDELRACDTNPAKAFELLTEIYTKKPEVLQNAIQKIARRLQDKIKRGELRPEQIASEAEEMMKEFSENSSFKDLMNSFKDIFGMEDPDLARQAGRPENAARSAVRERLRKKLEAKRAAKK